MRKHTDEQRLQIIRMNKYLAKKGWIYSKVFLNHLISVIEKDRNKNMLDLFHKWLSKGGTVLIRDDIVKNKIFDSYFYDKKKKCIDHYRRENAWEALDSAGLRKNKFYI